MGHRYVTSNQTEVDICTSAAVKKGDMIYRVIVFPKSTIHGAVTLKDGSLQFDIYPANLGSQIPAVIEIGSRSINDIWKISTGPSIECLVVQSVEPNPFGAV